MCVMETDFEHVSSQFLNVYGCDSNFEGGFFFKF